MIKKYVMISLVIVSLIVSGCAQATPTTSSPAPTSPPAQANTLVPPTQPQPTTPPPAAPTEAPTVAPAAFVPMKLTAPNCDYKGEFKSIEAVDQYTVKFTLCYPDAAFIPKITQASFTFIKKDDLDAAKGDSAKLSEHPNGTGPWVLKEWVKGDHITFETNPNYWGDKPKVKTLIFRWSDQAAQRLLELRAGTVDGIDNVSPDDMASVQADSSLMLSPRISINTFWLNFNNTIAPFDNIKVRQAIAMAIDRKRIVDTYYPLGSLVAEGMLPPTLKPGASSIPWYDFNIDAAKKLLAEAGYPNGFSAELSYRNVVRTYLPLPDKIAQEIQSQLGKIGITVKINQMESTSFLDAWFAGKLPLILIGGTSNPDATGLVNWIFNDSSMVLGKPYADIDQEAKIAAELGDPAQRQIHYDKINQMIKDYVPFVPIAHGASATAWKATIQGAVSSPVNEEDFTIMDTGTGQLIWDQGAEPAVLVCMDVNDDETNRACLQVYEGLVDYKPGTSDYRPRLAESWSANADATEWTFKLRQGVKYQNGASFDANDVVSNFIAMWDASSPNHVGRTATFDNFTTGFGAFLNATK